MAVLKNIQKTSTLVDTAFSFLPGAIFDFTIRAEGASGFLGLGIGNTIIFKGAAAPIQPMQFGINTRLKKTEYPGNDTPSAQILTHSKNPLRVKGELRDYQLGGLTAAYYMDQLRRVAKSKKPVSIEWGPIAKTGVLQEAQFNVFRYDYIEYDLTFDVISDFSDAPFELDFKHPFRTVLGIMAQLQNQFLAITSIFNNVPGGLGPKVLSKVSQPMNRAASTASRVF